MTPKPINRPSRCGRRLQSQVGGEDLVLESLHALEQRLDGQDFVRADRCTLVNLPLVSRLNPQERTCTLQAADGRTREVELSRNGIGKLLSALGR